MSDLYNITGYHCTEFPNPVHWRGAFMKETTKKEGNIRGVISENGSRYTITGTMNEKSLEFVRIHESRIGEPLTYAFLEEGGHWVGSCYKRESGYSNESSCEVTLQGRNIPLTLEKLEELEAITQKLKEGSAGQMPWEIQVHIF